MAVFIPIRDQERGKNMMPGKGYAKELKGNSGKDLRTLPGLASLHRWPAGKYDSGTPKIRPPYHLQISKEVPQIRYSTSLKLLPTTRTASALAEVRKQIPQQVGSSYTNNYVYHLTLAYLLQELIQGESNELKEFIEQSVSSVLEPIEFDTVSLFSFEITQRFNPEVFL
ncbi:hypothetical protein B0O99DRAFT_590483 [Bisporella sp. PMI_857]|nr:hypothetical protein B0O99DRAFT_590483 [Bisporella sp. PMI_857]